MLVVRILALLFGFCVLFHGALSQTCDADNQKFNDYGLKSSNSFDHFKLRSSALQLVAAGMRRKNLVVMEVDVYKVGIYLSAAKDKDSSNSFAKGKGFSLSSSTSDPISVGISLTFVRSVGTSKVVDAIVEALSGKGDKYKKSLEDFEKILLDGIGDGGVQNNDVIDFVLKGKSEIGVAVRGKLGGFVNSGELRDKLIEVYTGDKKAVAPEVVKILKKRYAKCK